MKAIPALSIALGIAVTSLAADPGASPNPAAVKHAARPIPDPTFANVAYGSDPRQMLDFWKADSSRPTPVLFFIHGGGWMNGDKSMVGNNAYYVPTFLKAGISVVSINYRMLTDAVKQGVTPPVKAPLEDAKRALQFVRSKAAEWNISKECIGAGGSSAGACSSLWLAFHDDMADPKSSDPIARESTRFCCVAVYRAQVSLDPKEMKEWIPNMNYGGPAFGFRGSTSLKSFDEFYAAREKVLPWIKEYSPYGWISSDDPPVWDCYNTPPAMGQEQKAAAHSANFGVKLKEKMDSVGVECHLVYPGSPDTKYPLPADFLIPMLQKCASQHQSAPQ
jgi:acetyl esterase/lipase